MEDQASQELVEMLKTFKANQEELIDQLTVAQKSLMSEITSQKEQLELDKVGRQSLALLLDEMAVKLRSHDE